MIWYPQKPIGWWFALHTTNQFCHCHQPKMAIIPLAVYFYINGTNQVQYEEYLFKSIFKNRGMDVFGSACFYLLYYQYYR